MKLSRSQVQPYLHKLQAELGTKDHARLVALSGALDEQAHQLTVSAALAAAFAESRSLESQNKLLGQLRERFNDLAEEAGFLVRCEVSSARAGGADKRFLWFEGETLLEVSHTTDELTRVSANLIEDRQGLPLHTEPRISLQALHPGSGPSARPLVRQLCACRRESTRSHRAPRKAPRQQPLLPLRSLGRSPAAGRRRLACPDSASAAAMSSGRAAAQPRVPGQPIHRPARAASISIRAFDWRAGQASHPRGLASD